MDVDRARTLLTAELSELDDRARFAEATHAETTSAPEEEGDQSRHTADSAADVTGTDEAELLLDTVADQRRMVQDALTRLETGEYGRCAVCGQEIDDERLEARPEARTCREHADAPVLS